MKKNILMMSAILFGMAVGFSSCSDSDKNDTPTVEIDPLETDYSAANADQWGNYMVAVASLLQKDATTLYNDWAVAYKGGPSFASTFKAHDDADYPSAISCIDEILDKCAGIAKEVGGQKIGGPITKYRAGQVKEALYAVESWFSYHSIEDYSNNIRSIRNAYYGVYDPTKKDSEVTPHAHSIATLLSTANADLDSRVRAKIQATIEAIEAIPAPFRDHIDCSESDKARTACTELQNLIEGELIAYFDDMQKDNPELDNIIQQFVDGVILPTYKDVKEKNDLLYAAVRNFQEHPTNVNFQNCASAWMASRTPWESSEAFLFGPVDAEGLDPNMDSWPLDASGIVAILNSSKFENMEWTGEYIPEPEDDEEAATMTEEDLEKAGEIAAAQNLRGFHTLEFLVFKKGQARRVN